MTLNVDVAGEASVYTQVPFEQRAGNPLYRAAQELVGRYAEDGRVLDLGCSDGVATAGLWQEVLGVDINPQDLAESTSPSLKVCADIRALPFAAGSLNSVSAVLALDVLEHEPWADSVSTLQDLRTMIGDEHVLIASLPIISPLTLASWKEGIASVRHGRPARGLFDRTHHILTGQRGHRRLFSQGGYDVIGQWQTTTSLARGLTGEWGFMPQSDAAEKPFRQYAQERYKRFGYLGMHAASEAATAVHTLYNTSKTAQNAIHKAVSYQGLYLAKPAKQ